MITDDAQLIRLALLLGAVALLLVLALNARWRRRSRQRQPGKNGPVTRSTAHSPYIGNDVQTADAMLDLWRLCFNAKQFNYSILGEHEKVMQLVIDSIPEAINSRKYFPRRPMVIPKLMSAIRNDDTTTRELVEIITQDPVLTGDVLRIANGPFYRVSKDPVETVARAVVILGTDGLRSVIANSVMQPVFKVPTGYYEDFAPTLWDLAVRSAMAAQAWARSTKKCNGFNAHLATLIHHISYIVLFKLTADLYQRASGSLPRPEVFTRIFEQQVDRVSRLIADDWELSDPMRQAFNEFDMGMEADKLCPIGRAVYLGRIAGLGALMHHHDKMTEEQVSAMIAAQGVPAIHAEMMWQPGMETSEYDEGDF